MKKLILYILLLLSTMALGQGVRLNVSGNLKVDTLFTDTLQVLQGSSNQILMADGSTAAIGSDLLFLNNRLSIGASYGSKNLYVQSNGTELALKNGIHSDTLVLPNATPNVAGVITTGPQVFSGIKSFELSTLLDPNGKLLFKSGSNLSDTTHWQISKNEDHHFVLENLKTGKAKLTFNNSGNLVVTDNQPADATQTAKIYSQGNIEAAKGFRVTGATELDLLVANGTTKRYSFYETKFVKPTSPSTADTLESIGINTFTPKAYFEINGTGYDMRKIFRISSPSDVSMTVNNIPTDFNYSGITFQRYNDEKAFFGLMGGAYSHFLINAKKVGIGTNNPTAMLHVNGTIQVDSNIKVSSSENLLVGTNGKNFTLSGLYLSNGVLGAYYNNLSTKIQTGYTSNVNLTSKDELFIINSIFVPDITLPSNPPTGTRIILKNLRASGQANRVLSTNPLRDNEGLAVVNYSLEPNKTMAVFFTGSYWLKEYDLSN